MSSEALPQSASSKHHQPSIWSEVVATREFGSLVGRLKHITGPWKAIKNKKFVVVLFDTLPQQLQVLKDGYLTALIGERPFKMNVQSIISLKEATEGKKIENVDTGVDVVDASNVDQFLKK